MNVLRDAMSVDSLDQCGIYFGTTGGQVYARRRRRHLDADRARSAGGVVGRSADAAMIRVVLPIILRNLARVGDEVELEVEGPVTQRSVLDALEARYPDAARHDPRSRHAKRRPFVRFFACEEDLSHEHRRRCCRTRPCLRPSRKERSRSLLWATNHHGGFMHYVDGYVLPVPKKNLQTYRRMAQKAGKIWREHGALEYRECVGDDLERNGTFRSRNR